MNALPDIWTATLAVTMGGAVACTAWAGARAVIDSGRDSRRRRAESPVWLRFCLPLATALSPALAPLLRRQWLERASTRLRRADLDEVVLPQEWCALHLLLGITASAIALTIGGGGLAMVLSGCAGALWPVLWLRDCTRKVAREIDRELPRFLELLTLAVEAGCAFGAALRIGVEASAAGVLQRGLAEALRAIHAGRPRSEALTSLVQRFGHPGLQAMLGAIVHAEMSGAGIAGTLRAQTVQRTEERFARAERLAMESPVKMLGPLILCIFPCAFLVIGFPIAHRLLQWT